MSTTNSLSALVKQLSTFLLYSSWGEVTKAVQIPHKVGYPLRGCTAWGHTTPTAYFRDVSGPTKTGS